MFGHINALPAKSMESSNCGLSPGQRRNSSWHWSRGGWPVIQNQLPQVELANKIMVVLLTLHENPKKIHSHVSMVIVIPQPTQKKQTCYENISKAIAALQPGKGRVLKVYLHHRAAPGLMLARLVKLQCLYDLDYQELTPTVVSKSLIAGDQ